MAAAKSSAQTKHDAQQVELDVLIPLVTGSFTATGVGFASPPTASWDYIIDNGVAHILARPFAGTSNATTFTITGMPAALFPAATLVISRVSTMDNTSFNTPNSWMEISDVGVVSVFIDLAGGAWTASGNKGVTANARPQTISYIL